VVKGEDLHTTESPPTRGRTAIRGFRRKEGVSGGGGGNEFPAKRRGLPGVRGTFRGRGRKLLRKAAREKIRSVRRV